MKHCCQNCHFLIKDWITSSMGQSIERPMQWSAKEREACSLVKRGAEGPVFRERCYKDVWNTGIEPALRDNLEEVLKKDRRDKCFFFPEQPGMSLSAGFEVFQVQNDNRQLKKSYRYTQWGLWIATVGILVNAALALIETFSKSPSP